MTAKRLVQVFGLLAAVFCLIGFFPAHAQDEDSLFTTKKNIEVNGYISSVQSAAFDKPNNPWQTSQLIHNRINASAVFFNNKFKAYLGLRNRLNWANNLDNEQFFPSTQPDQTGWVDANYDVLKGKSYRLNIDIDRFYAIYEDEGIALSAGRQRINWSQTFVWNPNDLFNSYSFFDIDYVERPGSDAIRLQYFPTAVSLVDAAIKVSRNKRITAGVLYRFNAFGYDIQGIAGLLEEHDYMAGLGWSGSLWGSLSFRGEVSLLHGDTVFRLSQVKTLAAMGFDYTSESSLTLQGEYFFNQLAPGTLNQNIFLSYLTATGNIKTLSPSRHNVVMQLSYPVSPLMQVSLAALYMPSIQGYYYSPTCSYSLAQNLDAALLWQSFAMKFNNTNLQYNLIMFRLKFYW